MGQEKIRSGSGDASGMREGVIKILAQPKYGRAEIVHAMSTRRRQITATTSYGIKHSS